MKIIKDYTSANYNFRPDDSKIEYIILHYTELSFEEALLRLSKPEFEVSSHYLIREDGALFNLVDEEKRAWHAGISCWKGQENLNNNSIGIEIDNLGIGEFSTSQLKTCIALCQILMQKYNIPPQNVIGHSDIAPSRKIDPGIFFKWDLLASHGIGTWYDEKAAAKYSLDNHANTGSAQKLQQKLGFIGYKIDITSVFDKQTSDVIRAFQSHFCGKFILKNYSIDYYRNLDNLYYWNDFAEYILNYLCSRVGVTSK